MDNLILEAENHMNKIGINKKIEKKAKRKKVGIIFIIFILFLSIFLMITFKTNFFHIKSIDINGNKNLSDLQIINASGIVLKENIMKVNLSYTKKNLLSMPYIKEVKIKRKLPNRIIIDVAEREEKFLIPYMGSYIYLDEDGYILRISPKEGEDKLPLLKGISVEEPQIGEKYKIKDGRNSAEINSFIHDCIKINIIESVTDFDFTDENNVLINLKKGIVVAFGPLDNIKYKLSYLLEILNDVNKKEIKCKYIYFNKGENPIIVTDNN